MADFYLASQSPRRLELLQQIGLNPRVISVETDESVFPGENADEYVLRVSKNKAAAGWHSLAGLSLRPLPVMAADTAVIVDEEIFGKPRDFNDAKRMWRRLSATEHTVLSSVVVQYEESLECCCQKSRVKMREITDAEMQAYWKSGEPCDKAGAYAIQGIGACFIEHISGSYSGIMGLPLFETAQILKGFGVRVLI